MTAIQLHYDALFSAARVVLAESFDGTRSDQMSKSHAFVRDLEDWASELAYRPEIEVLRHAIKEYQLALFSLAQGAYRSAFSSLRLTIELSMATVLWSANERELREWKSGTRDTNWTALSCKEIGVMSKSFVRLFTSELEQDAPIHLSTACALYRECSEYVHGNHKSSLTVPDSLMFDSNLFESWHQRAHSAKMIISFCLAARYLCDMTNESRIRLEPVLVDSLWHIEGP